MVLVRVTCGAKTSKALDLRTVPLASLSKDWPAKEGVLHAQAPERGDFSRACGVQRVGGVLGFGVTG